MALLIKSGESIIKLQRGYSIMNDTGLKISSLEPFSCSKLRCFACDKKIVRFSGDVAWKESVDYIFVRNFNTQPEKLEEGVQKEMGSSAYACQCQWLSVKEMTKVESLSHLQWHCGGH